MLDWSRCNDKEFGHFYVFSPLSQIWAARTVTRWQRWLIRSSPPSPSASSLPLRAMAALGLVTWGSTWQRAGTVLLWVVWAAAVVVVGTAAVHAAAYTPRRYLHHLSVEQARVRKRILGYPRRSTVWLSMNTGNENLRQQKYLWIEGLYLNLCQTYCQSELRTFLELLCR